MQLLFLQVFQKPGFRNEAISDTKIPFVSLQILKVECIKLFFKMALFDFYTDWANSITLLQSMMCYQRIFGAMMMLTIILLPMIFAFFQPNYDEMRFHERWLRKSKAHFFDSLLTKSQYFFGIREKSTRMFPTNRVEAVKRSTMLFSGVSSFFLQRHMSSVRSGL